MSRESTSYVYTIPVPRTGNRGLVGPSPALCWGRATRVMCNIWQYLSTSLKIKFYSTTRRTSRTSSRWSLTKKVRATRNFIKDKMRKCKKVKNEVTGTEKFYSENVQQLCFFGSCDINFIIFYNLIQNEYIDPSGHFVLYEIFCRSNYSINLPLVFIFK